MLTRDDLRAREASLCFGPEATRAFVLVLVVLGTVACAAPEGAGADTTSGSGGGTGVVGTSGWGNAGAGASGAAGAGGTGAESSGGGAGGSLGGSGNGGGGGGQPPGPGVACSNDLHQVLDASGKVVSTCAPSEGCDAGACVAACSAAEARTGNVGCKYFVPSSPFMGAGWPGAEGINLRGPCHALFVANAWNQPAKLTLRYGAQTLDATKYARIPSGKSPYPSYSPLPAGGLPPGEVAVVFLSHDPKSTNGGLPLSCPVPPAVVSDTALSSSGRGTAFALESDTPITAYDIIPYGGARTFSPSAALLTPVSAWGKSHLGVAPHQADKDPIVSGKLWLTLVGSVDGTSVQITPKATLPAGPALSSAIKGQKSSFTLNAGETVQWLGADPTGAVITSSAPIAAFTGNTYLWVTAGEAIDGGRDAAHQQLPPVSALGHEYVAGGTVTRLMNLSQETSVYRLVGVADGTSLSWEPAQPVGAPTSLSAGQAVEIATTQKFVVRSQGATHPFSFTQYMTGSVFAAVMRKDGTTPMPFGVPLQCGLGDEEWVNALPPEQFLSHYVFFTDPTFATTNLVVTRRRDASGFHDVTLGCLGKLTGWQPVGKDFEVAHVDLMRAGKPVAACNTSRHEASSDAPFGITVWGTDWCASYAYPAGGSFASINTATLAN
ncbi:MAG: IgGFc-binding protein [Myxococcales bacterium]|nr:IgGFc-binding protein [Myxococcales bacterium]